MTLVHLRLREWQSAGPERPELQGLDLEDERTRAIAEQLTRAEVIEVTELRGGVHVRARAHVGRVQLGRLVITVEPKVGQTELLTLVRYAYGLNKLRLFEKTELSHAGALFQDLLAAQLLAEVTDLTRRGLAKSYVQRSEVLASPRGRIDFQAVAPRGPAKVAELPCRHHLRSADHHLNRVMAAGVAFAARVAQDSTLRRSLRTLHARLASEIGEVTLTEAGLSRARRELNRLTSAYGPALRLIELLHACSAVSLDGESTIALPGFLFDMNRFFQALIGRFLSEHLDGYEVREEQRMTDMMRYVPGLNPHHRKPPILRPDFVVEKRGEPVRLLDAKYRDLWERKLPREMLYQLAIYSLSQQRPSTATILFPTIDMNASPAVIELRDPLGASAMGYVELRPVVLPVMVAAIECGDESARRALARKLALGGEEKQREPVRQPLRGQ